MAEISGNPPGDAPVYDVIILERTLVHLILKNCQHAKLVIGTVSNFIVYFVPGRCVISAFWMSVSYWIALAGMFSCSRVALALVLVICLVSWT